MVYSIYMTFGKDKNPLNMPIYYVAPEVQHARFPNPPTSITHPFDFLVILSANNHPRGKRETPIPHATANFTPMIEKKGTR